LSSAAPTYMTALKAAQAQGIVIVGSDRKGAGRVGLNPETAKMGLITAEDLNAQKARILLRLALTTTRDPVEIQRMFTQY
jgi:L-asparaginase